MYSQQDACVGVLVLSEGAQLRAPGTKVVDEARKMTKLTITLAASANSASRRNSRAAASAALSHCGTQPGTTVRRGSAAGSWGNLAMRMRRRVLPDD